MEAYRTFFLFFVCFVLFCFSCIFFAFCCFLSVFFFFFCFFFFFFGDFMVTVYILSLRIHLCDTRTLLSVLMHHPASLSLSLHVPWIRYRRSKREETAREIEGEERVRQKIVGEHQIENENPRRTRGSFHLSVRAPFIFFIFCACCGIYVVCALVIAWRR